MSADRPTNLCANCGATLLGDWCHRCGQSRRESNRLQLREIIARFGENLLDLDSALLRTFAGLTVRPGQLCRDYVEGRRKRYMNPFGYFLLAVAANVLSAAIAGRLFGDPRPAAAEGELNPDYATWLMLAVLVPFAWVSSRLFRRAGRNLAENYVLALYVLGHFVWFETLILMPLDYAVPEPALWTAYAVVWTAYVTFAAVPFYRERWYAALAKTLLSLTALIVALMLFGAVWLLFVDQPKP